MTDGDAEDELAGAEIGETVTVERRQRHHSINSAPSVFSGSDRDVDAEIVAINRIEVDGGFDDWEVVYRGDVTRTAPPYAERAEGVADESEDNRRHARLADWGPFVIGTAVAGLVGWLVFDRVANTLAKTPQPELAGPAWTVGELVLMVAMILLLLVALRWAPGMIGGRR